MKNIKITGILLAGILFNSTCLKAQVPAYQCELKNDTLLTSQVYEFDIYLKNISTVTFELGNFQAGIILNPLIVNGGNMNVSVIPGSSELNTSQQPSGAMFSVSENCLKIAPKSPPDFNDGSIIAETGSGTKICRIRLTNTLPFGMAKPNLSFCFAVFPYNTVVSAFDRSTHLNVNITTQGNHLTSGLNNPLLNGPISVYTVAGSGSYCQGSPGLPVTLNSSQADIRYQLKKDGVSDGGEVQGSGTLITWPNRPAGTYTISARRAATYLVANMTGNAVVMTDDPTAGGVVSGGTTITLGSPTDTLRLQGQLGTVITWQKQVNGGGYSDIPATAGLEVCQEIPWGAGTWEYRAMVQNGTCMLEGSAPAIVIVSAIPLNRSWTGVIDEKWNNPGNWGPTGTPGIQDDVVIPPTAPFMPVVKVQGQSCNNVVVRAGASLSIDPGITLTVNGNITLEE
jgi:hypothetical protein